ncbi:UNKNOWN [Stylonychia lemnae]|uniref:Uncharacterized protein n=1 Tax=Stylonychia lemnae TaxID=5949 RepID=A0A078ABQ9_STYLE|nr:UNKNOWN [Stylonychia lemnae]|eukprot:CDW79022.1 UNKNOWN [Stylonychia lemnae]
MIKKELEKNRQKRQDYIAELKIYQNKLQKCLKEKDQFSQQIEFLQHEISISQSVLKDCINEFNEDAFFEIGQLPKNIVKQKEVSNILAIFSECLGITLTTLEFKIDMFKKGNKNQFNHYDELVDQMSEMSRNEEKQTEFFKILDVKQWDKLLEIWKQKPVLDQLMKSKTDKQEKYKVKDNLRGLKIICKWICGLIEIHFKFQAICFVKKKLDKTKYKNQLASSKPFSSELQSTTISSKFERSIGESEFRQIKMISDQRDQRKLIPFDLAQKPKPRFDKPQQDSGIITTVPLQIAAKNKTQKSQSFKNSMIRSSSMPRDGMKNKQQQKLETSKQSRISLMKTSNGSTYDIIKESNEYSMSQEKTVNQESIYEALFKMDYQSIDSMINTKANNSFVKTLPNQTSRTTNKDIPRQSTEFEKQQSQAQYLDDISFYDVDLRSGLDQDLENFVNKRLQKLTEMAQHHHQIQNHNQQCRFFCF